MEVVEGAVVVVEVGGTVGMAVGEVVAMAETVEVEGVMEAVEEAMAVAEVEDTVEKKDWSKK